MKKLLFIFLLFIACTIQAQNIGETTTPYDTTGWDAPEDTTTHYALPIYRLLSNPGGWINISQRQIDSLLWELIVYTEEPLFIENDTLKLDTTGLATVLTADGSITWTKLSPEVQDSISDTEHIYFSKTTYTPNVTEDVYLKMTPTFTVDHYENIAFDGDTVTITAAGDYLMLMSFTYTGDANDDYSLQVRKNNVVMKTIQFSGEGTAEYSTVSAMCYGSCSIGDDISFYITNTVDSQDPTILDMTVYIDKQHD